MSVRDELHLAGTKFARALMELAPHLTPAPLELLDVTVVDPTRGVLYRVDLHFTFTGTAASFALQLTMMGTSVRRVRGWLVSGPGGVGVLPPQDWTVPGESPKGEACLRRLLGKAIEMCGVKRNEL